ncbi:MAG: hypothetical protein WC806_01400 [Candidatus Gracilibacteria bacterium]|jgi:CxxC-x17-CxxC domain-containing protein
MNKVCKNCGEVFEVMETDLAFLESVSPVFNDKKYNIPAPALCSECRQQRRLAWRNEKTLYKRKCDFSGDDIISVFSQDKPFVVYNNDYWNSDKWNAFDYGRDFDFNRPFFEQFEELLHKVPQLARSVTGNYNSDYVNQAGWNKNCYLIFEADNCENCMYSLYIYESKSCLDLFSGYRCELCYDCLNCQNSYNLKFSQNCKSCSDSFFLKDCIGCQNCFGCVNMRNKKFYFLNKQCTEEEYQKNISTVDLSIYRSIELMKNNFQKFVMKFPHKYINGFQNENSSGDYLWNTQRCVNCFDLENSQDCKNVTNARNIRNTMDLTVFGANKGVDFSYDSHELGEAVRNVCFSDQIWEGCSDLYYSKLCTKNCNNLFGCIGLKHQQYCILNKKYSEDEYNNLAVKIIEHMKKTGEWGEFFSVKNSPFAYNETSAQAYYPLTEKESLAKGYKWKPIDKKEYQKSNYKIPEKIKDVDDGIVNEILACEKCGKNYKISVSELDFYKKMKLPVPPECFDCRNSKRFLLKNPRKLFDRKCAKCGIDFQTTYSPDRSEKIYCEECFLKEVD